MRIYFYLILICVIGCTPPTPDNQVFIKPKETLIHEASQITISLNVKSIFQHLSYLDVAQPLIDKIQDADLGLLPEATFTTKDGKKKIKLLYESATFELNKYQIKVLKINRSKGNIEKIHIQIDELKKFSK